MTEKPAALGYRMPAEWEPHVGTWLAWPHNLDYWPDMQAMESLYVSIIRALMEGEDVYLLVNDEVLGKSVEDILNRENLDRVRVHIIPTNDIWIRDYGPNFLVGGVAESIACNQWIFNSWGGKYDMPEDACVADTLASGLGWRVFPTGVILEGGAIEVNGKGTCMTTEQCLLNKNRNTQLSRDEVNRLLQDYLGVGKVIWCKRGVQGDDTDGHIDNLARFVNADTVLCTWEEDLADANYTNLKENYEILKRSTNQDGKPLNVIRLPMPGYVGDETTRWPASYANFYIGNHAVLVPAFNHPNDAKAVALLKNFFPDRKVVSIPSRTLITGQGGLHCITQQQPG
ncbi:MAG: agmatine deiminase family protein [Nitrospinota bacterium]|nr:agmatine deiminase family protein [Nitrospinota bacterium]